MSRLAAVTLLCLAALGRAAHGQEDKKGKAYPGVDAKKVNLAIARGSQWLQGQMEGAHAMNRELILLAALHAGVDREAPAFKKLLKVMLDDAHNNAAPVA